MYLTQTIETISNRGTGADEAQCALLMCIVFTCIATISLAFIVSLLTKHEELYLLALFIVYCVVFVFDYNYCTSEGIQVTFGIAFYEIVLSFVLYLGCTMSIAFIVDLFRYLNKRLDENY